MNATQRKQLLVDVLKGVSRSFYLTLRVLPDEIGEQIALAYLLARAADTLADTSVLPPEQRINGLTQLRTLLIEGTDVAKIRSIQNQFKGKLANPSEQQLLQLLPDVFELFAAQEAGDQALIRKVVLTLTEGMIFDLHAFPSEESRLLKALDTAEQTDRYTYWVAGCVGEFWTEMSIAHIADLEGWDHMHLSQLGIDYGKALQMTNILRDLPRDLRIGRCYLSTEWLQQFDLSLEMLLDTQHTEVVRPLYAKAIELALTQYAAAEAYVLAIPEACTRLRLAALWPQMIGLATLRQLALSSGFLAYDQVIKISRRDVYKMIWLSFWRVGSNAKVSRWIQQARDGVYVALRG